LQGNTLYDIVPRVKQRIIDSFTLDALDIFQREFRFFEKVTAISGVLYPLPKDERRAQIRRELEKIEVEGDDLYLPTAPGKLVKGIEIDSGIPLQSAAKVPIMITFDVVEKDGDPNEIHCQKCIFKVGFTPWASCQEGVCTCAVSYYFQTHELCAHRIQNMCCIAAAHCYLLKHAKCKLFTCSSLVAVKFRNADLSHL
jgi:hypothetical protein